MSHYGRPEHTVLQLFTVARFFLYCCSVPLFFFLFSSYNCHVCLMRVCQRKLFPSVVAFVLQFLSLSVFNLMFFQTILFCGHLGPVQLDAAGEQADTHTHTHTHTHSVSLPLLSLSPSLPPSLLSLSLSLSLFLFSLSFSVSLPVCLSVSPSLSLWKKCLPPPPPPRCNTKPPNCRDGVWWSARSIRLRVATRGETLFSNCPLLSS